MIRFLDSSSFSARTFYRKRKNPTGIESLIAHVSCGSDSESDELDDDIEDPNYLLRISDVSDESEPVPMLSEITEDPPEVQGKAKQNKKPAINRPYWDKVSARDTTPSISPFLMQYEEDFEQRLPMEYFKSFISDELLDKICEQSNIYSVQKDVSKPLTLCREEPEQWIGIAMQMSITKLSDTRMHWSQYSVSDRISSTMTRQRWEDIKSTLHFVDNSTIDANDKLAKIRLLVDHLRQEFKKIPMSEFLSVDEQMVPFKGTSSMKQYVPKKPHKWGYKIFILADSTGVAYDFFPYTGKIPQVDNPQVPDLGPSSNSVLHLAECIPNGKNFKLHCDNWFTSLKLIDHLASRKIWVCGTIQEKRLQGLSFKSEKQLSALGRGSFEEFETQSENATITAVKWYDNRSVCLASSYATSYPVQKCKKFNKKSKNYDDVDIPHIVHMYNKHMGGVDLHDQMMAYYRMAFRSRKYYLRLVFHMIDMCVINSRLLYRRSQDQLNIKRHQQNSPSEFK